MPQLEASEDIFPKSLSMAALGLVAEVAVDGHGVRAQPDGVLDGGDQGFGVGEGGKGGGGGQVDDEPDVLALGAVAATDQPLVLDDGVGPAIHDPSHGLAHVDQSVDGTDGHAVVHGDHDGPARVAVEDALQPDGFTDVHDLSPLKLSASRSRVSPAAGKKTRAAGFRLRPLKKFLLSCDPPTGYTAPLPSPQARLNQYQKIKVGKVCVGNGGGVHGK